MLAPNHYSEIDPLIVAVAVWRMGRAPRFMAKESLFTVPVLGWALRATGMVPVARSSSAAAARQTIAAVRGARRARSRRHRLPRGHAHARPRPLADARQDRCRASRARADGIPLIPMAHWGAQEILPRYGKLSLWPLRRPVQVHRRRPGRPLRVRRHGHSARRARGRRPIGVMNAIAQLLGAAARRDRLRRERWNPAEHGQKETGRLEP